RTITHAMNSEIKVPIVIRMEPGKRPRAFMVNSGAL
ncbi:hypothetical protein L195_g064530, partial [Trifolium pratense]